MELPKDTGKLKIFMWVSENSGVGYYRSYLPALKLREAGLADVLISDFRWGEGNHVIPDMNQLMELCNWADVIVVGRQDLPQFYAQWGGIREFFNMPIILDSDDNVRHVRPNNPGYQGYYPGSEAIVWNKYATAKIFDALTVTTKDLKEFHEKENPKIYVLPNSLDMKEWKKHPIKKHEDGMIRAAFIGSAAHSEGMHIIKNAVRAMLEKHPNFKFMVTHVYRHLFTDLPQDRVEYMPWIPLQTWQKEMRALGIDIGLAPLADNLFNRAKSNLRFIEFSAAGMAPIVSPVAPYLCVQDKKTGLVAKEKDDWAVALDTLISNEKFRKTIQKNAFQYVDDNFDIEKNIHMWYNAYKEVHDKYHDFFGKKKRLLKVGKEKYKVLR